MYKGIVALVLGVNLVFGTYVVLQVEELQDERLRMDILESEHRNLKAEYEAHLDVAAKRLDEVETMLHGEVVAKMKKPPVGPTKIELWMQNSTKDSRERITRIEREMLDLQRLRGELQRLQMDVQRLKDHK